jgi:hypothetical protein
MRDLRIHESKRIIDSEMATAYGKPNDPGGGAFSFASPLTGERMVVIASVGEGWDHVSVSFYDRAPSWSEMDWVKRGFFKDDETAMQLHVPTARRINIHPHCLHLWRPHGKEIPLPPERLV